MNVPALSPRPLPAAAASPPDLLWEQWSRLLASSWQSLEVGMDLQQQCLHRWTLRQQEASRHWQHAGVPAVWMDVSLAAMRWGLQEWDQALQDGMAAPVFLHGDWPVRDELPWLNACSQWVQLPWLAWAQCCAVVGRQRCR